MHSYWKLQRLDGVFLLEPEPRCDHRGAFTKTFHVDWAKQAALSFTLREEFYTTSRRDVIRGMHFQIPPHAHQKIVYCIHGSVLDVIVDLRKSSRTFRSVMSVRLCEENRKVLWLPPGVAHGFLSETDECCMVYKTDAAYEPDFDTGIRWDSIDFDWPCESPIISARDKNLPSFTEYLASAIGTVF